MILILVFYFSKLTFGQFCSISNCDICRNRIQSVRKDQRFICRVSFSWKISIVTKAYSCWLKRQLVVDDLKELQVGSVRSFLRTYLTYRNRNFCSFLISIHNSRFTYRFNILQRETRKFCQIISGYSYFYHQFNNFRHISCLENLASKNHTEEAYKISL